MDETRKSLLQRFGAEAILTTVIATIAVLVAVASFQQHTIDFEIIAQRDIQRIEDRLNDIEERERSDTQVLARVDAHVEGLRMDMIRLREQVSTVLTRLPSPNE